MIDISPIPAFTDNYLWLIQLPNCNRAFVVDPGDAEPVEQALAAKQLELAGIIITHHHWDHTGGIEALTANRNIPVYGPDNPATKEITHPLKEGDQLNLGNDCNFEVISVPGHTLDHLAYFCPSQKLLLCGDTLFAGGCGRLFEGSAEQMHHSLTRLAALPADTKAYCTHEYTLSNLTFALAAEPDNLALQQRFEQVKQQRQQNLCTLPTSIALECDTNPFLRCQQEAIIKAISSRSDADSLSEIEVFAGLRRWKDNF